MRARASPAHGAALFSFLGCGSNRLFSAGRPTHCGFQRMGLSLTTMWGNTLIIDRLHPSADHDDLRAKEEDKLILSWEQRRWMRGRFTTMQGRKIGVALPTGTTLSPGAILYVGADWYLKIEGAIESVLEIFPSGYSDAVKIAFEIGNRHFPLALEESKILVPDDKVMVRLMERLGAPWERRQAIFDPIGNTPLHQHESIS
jgi:urease accessory protein